LSSEGVGDGALSAMIVSPENCTDEVKCCEFVYIGISFESGVRFDSPCCAVRREPVYLCIDKPRLFPGFVILARFDLK